VYVVRSVLVVVLTGQYRPAVHGVHDAALAAEKAPIPHGVGVTVHVPGHAYPAGHAEHSGVVVLAVDAYRPAVHGVGIVDAAGHHAPGGQSVHSSADVRFVAAE
jgi:hypothetical protein